MIQKIQKNGGDLNLSSETSIHIIQLWRQMDPGAHLVLVWKHH